MSDTIDYYFTSASPFVWLGHRALLAIAEKHQKAIRFKPMDIAVVWAESGAVPVPARPAVRQRYRLLELQRAANCRGLAIVHQPTNFPVNPELADLCSAALVNSNQSPANFLANIGDALWANDQLISDPAVISSALTSAGHNAEDILTLAGHSEATDLRRQNSKDAVTASVVGAPGYVYRGEVFWGQDRIEYLDAMLTSGRDPYTA